jgi:hypothetical protein
MLVHDCMHMHGWKAASYVNCPSSFVVFLGFKSG